MRNKTRKIALTMALLLSLTATAFGFSACGGEESSSAPAPTQSTGETSTGGDSENGGSSQSSSAAVVAVPTAAEVVTARQKVAEESAEGYDFTLKLDGNLSAMGLGASLDGTYDGQYRYDSETDSLQFKRVTSGALLNDSTAYVMSKGVQRIKVTVDKGKVKKMSVMTKDEEENFLIQKPFVGLIDSLTESEIGSVKKLSKGGYQYEAPLNFKADNKYLNTVLGIVGKLGTTISVKGAQIDNPVNGLKMQFNINADGELHDFALSLAVEIPVSVAKVKLNLSYKQQAASAAVEIPSTAGLAIAEDEIKGCVDTVNAALADIQNDETYSLDLLARNELDAGWNKKAVKDSYKARMYKHTTDAGVWFNHSYEYKAHHEEDGAETYKYTIGNIQEDNNVYLVSRKGSNVVTQADGITLDTQFAYLTEAVTQKADSFECVKTEKKDGSTFYYMYLTKAATIRTQDIILGLVNSNEAEGVLDVNNYFDETNYTVKDASLLVEIKNGKLVDITCETELLYTPTDGAYVDYQVTLNNTLTLTVNENLSAASAYEAPKKAKGNVVSGMFGSYLSDAGKYIL